MRLVEELKMNEAQYHRAENLHLNFYAAAFSGLLGSVGRETFKKLNGKWVQTIE